MGNPDISKRIRQAAQDGESFAQFEMGLDFDFGTYGEQDFQKAADYLAKAVRQGHQSAERQPAIAGCSRPSEEPARGGFRSFEESSSGDREAQNNFGLCFQLGYGTAQDYGEAAVWFRRAAKGGLATAQFNLGGLY
jgi:uncharacterized protein